jgi:RNA polymerase sigma factor (sigma-70 family)
MSIVSNDSLATRRSLLSRLRNLDDNESWRTFFDLYWKLIYNVARRAGLDESLAQDVVQDTIIAVAREMPRFHYDPAKGSFKQWLFRITGRRICDHLRRVYRQPLRADIPIESLEDPEANEGLAAASDAQSLDAVWKSEWEQQIFEAAVAHVRAKVNPKHFQVFDYCVLKEWPAAKVAATLGLNAAQVYLAKHRVAAAVKRAAREINAERSREGLPGSII